MESLIIGIAGGSGSGSGAGPQAAKPRHRAAVSRAARMFRKRLGLLPKGASIFCGKSLPLRGRICACGAIPPPLSEGMLDWRTTAMEHPYFIAAYLTVFSPPWGETKLKISLSGNSCSGKTPRPAPQGAKPGVSSQAAGVFAGTQARI